MQPELLDYNLLVKLVTDLSSDITPKSWHNMNSYAGYNPIAH
jgi:hypothetical protein